MRSRVPLVALALATALAASASAGGSAPVCHAGQLRGKLFDSTGAAGTIVLSITLQNTGSICSMKGYAGLRLENGHALLPTRVVHGGLAILAQRPRLVILAHGGYATVLVAYGDVPTGSESRCPTSTAIWFRPPSRLSISYVVRVVAHAQACNHGTLRESPVLLGRRHAP